MVSMAGTLDWIQARAFTLVHFSIFAALLARDRARRVQHRTLASRRASANRPRRSRSQKFAPLRGKHVGLITNHTGLDSQGRSTVMRLIHARGFN